MRLLDRLLGGPEDEPDETDDVGDMLARHERALQAVDRVLTDAQSRVAEAIDDTGSAIESHRPKERRFR